MELKFRENGIVCLRGVKNYEIIPNKVKANGEKICFRNFEGRKEKWNDAGNRNFTLSLPEDIATELNERGFNVRMKTTETQDGPRTYYNLKVNLKYYGAQYDPKVYFMQADGGHTVLDENSVKLLDDMRFAEVAMDIYPKTYIDMKTGEEKISARLNKLLFTQEVDDFEREFALTSSESASLPEDDDLPF